MAREEASIQLSSAERYEVIELIKRVTEIMNYKSDQSGHGVKQNVKIYEGNTKPLELKYAGSIQLVEQAVEYELSMTRKNLADLVPDSD